MLVFAVLLIVVMVAFALGVFFFIARMEGDRESTFPAFCCFAVAMVFGSLLIVYVVPNQLGVGRVAIQSESYTRVLTEGGAYELIAHQESKAPDTSVTVNVLLIRQYGTERYFTIRVRGDLPPPLFTLVDGKPVTLGD